MNLCENQRNQREIYFLGMYAGIHFIVIQVLNSF